MLRKVGEKTESFNGLMREFSNFVEQFLARMKMYQGFANVFTAMTQTSRVGDSAAAQKEPPALVKKIGKMTCVVRMHFSTTGKIIFADKVNRLFRQEVRQMMENEAAGE